MSSPHIPRHGLHCIGFSTQESAALESFFKIAGQRPPGWWVTPDIRDAAIVLLNAHSSEAVEDCQGMMTSWQKLVIVGSSDFGSGWPFVPRPIKLMAILGKINQVLVERTVVATSDTVHASLESTADAVQSEPMRPDRQFRATEPAPLVPAWAPASAPQPEPMIRDLLDPAQNSAAPPRSMAPTKPVSMDAALSFVPPKAVQAHASSASHATMLTAVATAPAQAASRVLVVDDSEVALKFMQNRLHHFGYLGQTARSGEEALALVAQTPYKFVFMDVMMAGLDGYQTCRAIKQNKGHHGEVPRVIMLTSRGGTIDKLRGSMAGCDAYLTKPLNERQLAAVLIKFDPSSGALGKSEMQGSVPTPRFGDARSPSR